MSIFPTKILLATDGSKQATLAAKIAVDIADKTNSELHVVHVLGFQGLENLRIGAGCLFTLFARESTMTSTVTDADLNQ